MTRSTYTIVHTFYLNAFLKNLLTPLFFKNIFFFTDTTIEEREKTPILTVKQVFVNNQND